MIPTKQTILHDPANGKHGNCFSAVPASLLHLPIEDVPVFSDSACWQKDLNAWLRPKGLCYLQITDFDLHCEDIGIEGCHHEVAGYTRRSNEVLHALVAVDGDAVFDPHPDNTGITNVSAHGVFIALKPWEVMR